MVESGPMSSTKAIPSMPLAAPSVAQPEPELAAVARLVRCARRNYPPVVAFGRLEVEPLGCCPIWRESLRRMAQVGSETRKHWASDQLPSRSLQWGSGAQRMLAECTREIAEQIGLSSRSVRTRLARLVERGLVSAVGTGPHDPRRK